MVDSPSDELRADSVWRDLGRNLAAGTGALTALLSLLSGATLVTACLRGGAALFGVLLLTRVSAAALAYLHTADPWETEEQVFEDSESPHSPD